MKYTIDTKYGELGINVENVGDRRDELLQALHECAAGRCSCPTTQYEKLDAIDIYPGQGTVRIALKAKPGESISAAEIDRCMEYTARRVENDSGRVSAGLGTLIVTGASNE